MWEFVRGLGKSASSPGRITPARLCVRLLSAGGSCTPWQLNRTSFYVPYEKMATVGCPGNVPQAAAHPHDFLQVRQTC
ncbi:hypothetical protein BPORC_1721 [Bifidobacterium porcinum]|nr:hypothetical protein BPORC_1721 [Bifidobacterium porcinum]